MSVPPSSASQEFAPDSAWSQVLQRLRAATAGEFVIQSELGRGGFAAVFLAHEVALGRKVAIKVMSPAVMMGDGMVERFLQEARTVASLNHPHIITIHSVRRLEELPFFVMKFVRGRSLEHLLRREGPLPGPVVRDLLFQVGSALAYAHRRGVIHRDVKPANILLDDEGNAIVTDFGIAKVAEAPNLTVTGMVIGTVTYMSPEQCDAQAVGWASDQYSLGIVAYEMLTGTVPFSGSNLAVMHAHAHTPPPPIRSLRPDCPPNLEAAVNRMLAKDPAERWPTMAEALAALGAVPVPDADPLRQEIARLARLDLSNDDDPRSTVPSPVPQSRSPIGQTAGGAFSTAGGAFSLAVSAPPEWLPVGRKVRLDAVLRDPSGREVHRRIEWRSSAPAVATVTGEGVVSALGYGEAAITASAEGTEESVRLLVGPPPRVGAPGTHQRRWWWAAAAAVVAAIAVAAALALRARGGAAPADSSREAAAVELSTTESAVTVGDSAILVATVKNDRGLPILGKGVTWMTSDPAVVRVDSNGMIVARSPGTAEVTATSDRASGTAAITVTAKVAAAETAASPVATRPLPSPPAAGGQPAPPVPPPKLGDTRPARGDTAVAAKADTAVATVAPVAPPPPAPVAPEPATGRIRELAAGGRLTCGTLTGGQTLCWGAGERGPIAIAGFRFAQVTIGDAHACALTAAGEAYCWGANAQGQLGDGTSSDRLTPVPVKLAQRFSALSAGATHTCGVALAGVAYCWGSNGSGQLGTGTEQARPEPTPVRGNFEVKQISAGGAHTCALTNRGELFCWGDGSAGQLGNKTHEKSLEPFLLETSASFKAITAGNRHTCALTDAGKAYCWGENAKGQLGDGSTDDRPWPQPVVLIEPFRAIDAGAVHTCGLLAKGGLFCWGDNSGGQLGDGTRLERRRPTAVTGGQRFETVQAGAMHTCGTAETGRLLLCWGSNSQGQAGGSSSIQTTPAEVHAAP